MSQLFHLIIYQPLFNILVFLYNIVPGHDIGIAIILLTLLVKVILHPLTRRTTHHQKGLQALAPQVKKLKEKHKGDPVMLSQETMKLYKEYGVSPAGGCLPLFIQIPILIGLFQVFRMGFTSEALSDLYSFIANTGALNPLAFGFLDLSKKITVVAVVAGAAQFIQGYFFTPRPEKGTNDTAQIFSQQMIFMAPAITFFISLTLPSALPFYWLVNTLFTIIELRIINQRYLTSKN